uniref:Uncharacterized protein n=1 Tax=Babesia bovis TaxID=5865 RepID=S6B8M1_BABBO|nr:hypothetical protein [Babesia bovis]
MQQQMCKSMFCYSKCRSLIQGNEGNPLYVNLTVRFIHEGFQFDRISTYKPINNLPTNQLDDVSRISIKTLPFPNDVSKKLFRLLKVAAKKRDIDACGSYISKRLASRRCVEVPRVLPSLLLDTDIPDNEYVDALKKLTNNPAFAHLKELLQQNKLGSNEQAQIELAEAEDARHKNSTIHFSPNIAIAHTAHTFFGYYAVCLRIFNEIKKRAPNFKPSRIMFYHSGAGASVAAAHSIWDLASLDDVLIVEPSKNLLNISEYLLPEFKNLRNQHDVYDNTELFDCIVVPYHLTNIRGSEARSLLIRNLWNKISIGGYMVLVEVGTPTGFRILHAIRELFISQLNKGCFHFLAPCPHEGICPLALTGKDWCHFSQRIYRTPHYLYRKGSISRSIDNEKFSYLVIGKSSGPRYELQNESKAKYAHEKSYFWPRIIMQPLKLGRRVIMDICANPNNFERIIVPKNSPESSGYRYARDAIWGDLWRFPYRVQQPVARAYTPESIKRRIINREEQRVMINETKCKSDPQIEGKMKKTF